MKPYIRPCLKDMIDTILPQTVISIHMISQLEDGDKDEELYVGEAGDYPYRLFDLLEQPVRYVKEHRDRAYQFINGIEIGV